MGETPKAGRFGPSRSLRLALVPATGLAVFAFTTPAHAEDASAYSLVPPSLTSSAPDAVQVQPDPSEVQTTVSSVVGSIPVVPAGDGSATDDPVPALEAAPVAQPGDASTSAESPANQAVTAAPEDSSALPESPSDPVATQPVQDAVDGSVTAAISVPEARAAATRLETAADLVESHSSTQYQSTPKQYHASPAVDLQPSKEPRTAIAPHTNRTVRGGRPHVALGSSKSVQILSLICADIDRDNPVFSAGVEAAKSDWNIAQIGSCIVDLSGSDEVPGDVATPSECESGSQYQPQDGQYQTVACEPGVGESSDATSTAPTECIPEIGEAIDQVAPIELVIGEFSPFDGSTTPTTCAGSPIGGTGTATAPVVANPQGAGGVGAEAGTVTPTPASPVSQQPVEKPTPQVERGKHRASHRVSGTKTVDRSGVGGWVSTARPLQSRPQAARAKPRPPADTRRMAPRLNPETSGPPARFEALQAERPERSSSSGAPTSGGSAWLAAAALLLLFALGSFGLAVAGIPAPAGPAALSRLRSRITSKGLSRHPIDGTHVDGPQGIRYRE